MDSQENKDRLLEIIRESSLIEEAVEFVSKGRDTRPLFVEFFGLLGEEYADEYAQISNMAEAVALTKIDAFKG